MPPPANAPSSAWLPAWIAARLEQYLFVARVAMMAASFHLHRTWTALRTGTLLSHSSHTPGPTVREQAFADWYLATSHDFSTYEAEATPVPALVASAHDVVIDLGPATGNQLPRFNAPRIAHVYGVEPNPAFAAPLAARLREEHPELQGKYTLVPCGIGEGETLAGYGLVEGSVDCVVSIQVMCSLPDLEDQVRNMYRLLKPGGELIFWEHIRSADPVSRAVQWLLCLVWPGVVGGCRLDRVTQDKLVKAADWSVVDIQTNYEAHLAMPRIWGRLVKPGLEGRT